MALSSSRPAVVLLASTTALLGVVAGLLLSGDRPMPAAAPARDLAPLVEAVDALRVAIGSDRGRDGAELAVPSPRFAAGAPSQRGADAELVEAIRELRAAIEAMPARGASGGGGAGSYVGDDQVDSLMRERRPKDRAAIERLLDRHPTLTDGKMPIEFSFYGLADHLKQFGVPDRWIPRQEGLYWLEYDFGVERGTGLEITCSRTGTKSMKMQL